MLAAVAPAGVWLRRLWPSVLALRACLAPPTMALRAGTEGLSRGPRHRKGGPPIDVIVKVTSHLTVSSPPPGDFSAFLHHIWISELKRLSHAAADMGVGFEAACKRRTMVERERERERERAPCDVQSTVAIITSTNPHQ